jgi:hypothetical protein
MDQSSRSKVSYQFIKMIYLFIFVLCSTLCHILNYGEFNDRDITTVRLNDPNDPIKVYQTSYGGRVEYIRAGMLVSFLRYKFRICITIETIIVRNPVVLEVQRIGTLLNSFETP